MFIFRINRIRKKKKRKEKKALNYPSLKQYVVAQEAGLDGAPTKINFPSVFNKSINGWRE
jgi:hypothetical protein